MSANVRAVKFKDIRDIGAVTDAGLVSVTGTGRLSDEKCKLISADLETVISQVFKKHGVDLSRKIFKRENSREVSIVIRGSIVDANGLDALHRDLLEYCHVLRFKASILNASIVSDGQEYQISGLDLSTNKHQFRVTSVTNANAMYMSLAKVQEALPAYFY